MKPQRYGIVGSLIPQPDGVMTPQPNPCPPPALDWEETHQPEPDIRKTLKPDMLDI